MKVAIIGGGAAGFFAAIAVKENHPQAQVSIFEKSQKILSKVRVSGGGRCNVTNGCDTVSTLLKAYPRGGKKLKKLFYTFSNKDTMAWFEKRGVPLKTESDNRVFPKSDNSQSIIDCLVHETNRLHIKVEKGIGVQQIIPDNTKLKLLFSQGKKADAVYDKVVVASGGSPTLKGLAWLKKLRHKIESPVPSLFTFNMPHENITQLMGVVTENTLSSIQGTKLKSDGPLLITHWGMSGPSILKLSSFGARDLAAMQYQFKVQINWIGESNQEAVMEQLEAVVNTHPNKILANIKPFGLAERLWLFLLEKIDISPQKKWNELGKKGIHKIINILTHDIYQVKGKTTFKEEFVSCGGVSLESVNLNTMESKVCKNLYFAGEVLDIDAITGGYNFQAAWSTAFVAGKLQ